MPDNAYRLVEVTGAREWALCAADYPSTLEAVAARLRARFPGRHYRVEANTMEASPCQEPAAPAADVAS